MYSRFEVKNYLSRFNQILCFMANRMLSANMTNNITLNFIRTMIPHHQAAIYMSENLLKYSKYEPLREIAKGIIEMQTEGIEQMRNTAKTTPCFSNSAIDTKEYIEQYLCITKSMILRMKDSQKSMNIDLDFVNEMIPHHEGAIAMSMNLLKYEIDPRLGEVAQTIIREQSEGIRELKEIKENIDNIKM